MTANSVKDMKAAVAKGPIAVSVDAAGRFWSSYKSGVIDSKTRCGTSLDHAVLVAGYGTDPASGEGYWLVKNSWGADWGEKGYIKLAIVEGKGTCGVQMEPLIVATN